mgnify:CR=1 FL=1
MKMNEITQLKQTIQQKHPEWSQEKAQWMAMQMLGMIGNKKK